MQMQPGVLPDIRLPDDPVMPRVGKTPTAQQQGGWRLAGRDLHTSLGHWLAMIGSLLMQLLECRLLSPGELRRPRKRTGSLRI